MGEKMSEPLPLYALLGSWFLVAVIRMWEQIREAAWLEKMTKDHFISEVAGVVGCCLFIPELVIFTIGLIGLGSMLMTLVDCWRFCLRKDS
jgi:hypothetical protein